MADLGLNDDGIRRLYKPKPGGAEVYDSWRLGPARRLSSGKDPEDLSGMFHARGNGAWHVLGRDGEVEVSGSEPRWYVYKDGVLFGNVEVTVYSTLSELMKPGHPASSAGIILGIGFHNQVVEKDPATFPLASSDYARLTYNGRAVFQVERAHHRWYSTNYPKDERGQDNTVKWPGGAYPVGQPLGLKYVRYVTSDGSVRHQMFVDRTNGRNGGTWERVADWLQREPVSGVEQGNQWTDAELDSHRPRSGRGPMRERAPALLIRNTGVRKVTYSRFHIMEIEP